MVLNMLKKIKLFLKDEKAQVSLEFVIIIGIVILVALSVAIYVKQLSAKHTREAEAITNQATQ